MMIRRKSLAMRIEEEIVAVVTERIKQRVVITDYGLEDGHYVSKISLRMEATSRAPEESIRDSPNAHESRKLFDFASV
jgi:hypothetical protein